MENHPDDIGFFEFDYHVMSQEVYEPSITNLNIDSINEKESVVSFRLHNAGETIPMRLVLVKENGNWKVDNFIDTSGSGYDCRSEMESYIKK